MRSLRLARLNHILIPTTAAERDRWRSRRVGRILERFLRVWLILTLRGRVLVFVILLVGGFGIEVASTQVYLLFSLLFGVLLGLLLARIGFDLPGVRVVVHLPKRVAVGDEVRFQVRVENRGDRDHATVRVRGPFLPWDGRWIGPAPMLESLEAGATQLAHCAARFAARGEHQLEPFAVQAALPLGITLGNPVSSDRSSILVVPRIVPIGRLSTPITRRHQPGGVALASKTGESMDLLGIRNYRPGDPLRDLHARSWARLGVPVVREYQEEYFTRVGVVVDIDKRAGGERQLEAALSLAAGVVAHLSRGEALIDLLVVGDQVHALTLGRSLGFLDQALDLLACVTAADDFDAARTAGRLSPHLARLSCLVFVAMAWDAERRAFADRVQRTGVACRTVIVDPPESAKHARPTAVAHRGDQVTHVSLEAVEKGTVLWL
jgi:uncharacterized protein (DUF58 family)